ncbi:MAG TPA: hypothetical protein VNK44_01275 [Candidatus Nitrosotenuis sp.]|nr:hypothetical protein [Candidatus Nitrosotenuis sp.]
MDEADGLDRWMSDKRKQTKTFSGSLFPHERLTLLSLKERILELEKMRDQILYELDRLRFLSEDRLSQG